MTHLGSLLGLEVLPAGFCGPDLDDEAALSGRDEVVCVRDDDALVDDESLEDEGALEGLLDDDDDDVVLVVRLDVASLAVRLDEGAALDGVLEVDEEDDEAFVDDLTLDDEEEDADGLEDEDLLVEGLDLDFCVAPVDLGSFSLSFIVSQDQMPFPGTVQTEIK